MFNPRFNEAGISLIFLILLAISVYLWYNYIMMIFTERNRPMAIKIAECACCGNRDSSRFIQKDDGYICKTCGVWFRYETEEEKAGCMDGRRRLKNYRFDDARETFMEVLDKYPGSIDALWGSLLARYGIVFVKGFFDDSSEPIYCFPEYDEYGERHFRDERAYKKIIRLLEEKNEDFRLSDFYESKAKEIDRAIAKYSECKKSTDVDVFICVKISAATEDDPQRSGRTADYEYALKVYDDLKKRGVNAFFSFVTLKNNVESDDLIWVNLVKSKKMLIIGSAEEYLDSVWVKSEWKRWLYLGRENDLYICSMKHDNEYPKSILPRELASLRPQVYTLDTYEKMIDELCEGIEVPEVILPSYKEPAAPTVITAPASVPAARSGQDGEIVYADGRTEALKYGVREIGPNAYKGNEDIVSVVLPESVKKINISAFSDCAFLESITLPKSLKNIEGWAFQNCESLTDITISGSVKTISPSSFWGCTELSEIIIENGVESIDNQAFYGCASLKDITIPDSVTFIGSGIFTGCTSLESVTMPKSITSTIGNALFDKCKKLKKITLPEGATAIDGWAFQDCAGLTEVNIPETVTSIGTGAFWNCSQIKSINIPKGVTSIADKAFAGCTGLKNVYYGGTEAEWKKLDIGEGNPKLKEAKVHFSAKAEKTRKTDDRQDGKIVYADGHEEVIKWGVTEITAEICKKQLINDDIIRVVLPSSVTTIGTDAFSGCWSLTDINIPDSVTSIQNKAFLGCRSLTNITLPNSVTYIGNEAFLACRSLADINIPKNITSISNDTFGDCVSLTNITLPDSLTLIGEGAFSGCKSLTSIAIPDTVTSIGTRTFCSCNSLIEINISDSVNHIGENAFLYCIKPKINISPKNKYYKFINNYLYTYDEKTIIEYIPKDGFTSLTIPNGVTAIGKDAFYGCGNLIDITIPNGVTSIGDYAFGFCENLVAITIPDSVTTIGQNIFYYCDKVKTIYYKGSAFAWKKIRISQDGNEKLVGSIFKRAKIHYNSK